MDKLPLILFSGGLDSTCAVIHALQTSDVDVLAVVSDSLGELKVTAEKKARDAIFKKLNSLYNTRKLEHRIRTVYETKVDFPDPRWNLNGLQQVELWLMAAGNTVNPDIHRVLQIGYVKGDCAIPFLPNITAVWDNLQVFRTHMSCTDYIKIEFPIKHFSKEVLFRDLAAMGHQWVVDMVWTCETPGQSRKKIIPCGKCVPCVTEAGAQLKYFLNTGKVTTKDFGAWARTMKPRFQPALKKVD